MCQLVECMNSLKSTAYDVKQRSKNYHNLHTTGNAPVCDWIYKDVDTTVHVVRKKYLFENY